jgi:hypothetical protein
MGIIKILGDDQISSFIIAKNQLHIDTRTLTHTHKSNKMTGIITCLSILTLNGFSCPIIKHRLMSWIENQDHMICCSQEIHLTERNKHWLWVKG